MKFPAFANYTWNLNRNTLPVEVRAYMILVDELQRAEEMSWKQFYDRLSLHIENLRSGVYGSGPEIPDEVELFTKVLQIYETTVTRRSVRENLAKAFETSGLSCLN